MDAIDRELMVAAIDRLPGEEQEVINGLFFERTSYRAIAIRMGCSTTKVIDLRDQALGSLRALIESTHPDD